LIGHSEGGLIAPMVADERKEVKFIVILAGPGIPTIDLMQQQWEAIDVSNGWTLPEARLTSGFLRMMCGELEETFSPTALAIMDDWLLKNVQ
jgi:hypothetical protein